MPRDECLSIPCSTLPALIFITAYTLANSSLLLVTTSPAYASPRKPNLGMPTSMAPHIPSPHGRPHQRCKPNARYSTVHPVPARGNYDPVGK